jgi:hypothetical protein
MKNKMEKMALFSWIFAGAIIVYLLIVKKKEL